MLFLLFQRCIKHYEKEQIEPQLWEKANQILKTWQQNLQNHGKEGIFFPPPEQGVQSLCINNLICGVFCYNL